MPEEPENKEEQQETPGPTNESESNPGGAPESNGAATPEDLQVIKAELEEERQAKTAAQAALAQKDTLIAELEAKLHDADENFASLNTQVSQLKEAHTQAVAKYLDAVKLANPTLPGDVIVGSTIEEIDAALAKAVTIAGAVKASLEAEAKQARVPAGAPPRGEISLDGLSPREKIVAGIQQKGGTS